MMFDDDERLQARTKPGLVRIALFVFGAYSLALGLFMVIAPGAFFDSLGPFGPRNDHYIHDNATFELPLGLMLLTAIRRPSWRVPALVFATAHWVLHTLSHLADIGETDPGWIGAFDFVSLAVGTVLLAAALAWAASEPQKP